MNSFDSFNSLILRTIVRIPQGTSVLFRHVCSWRGRCRLGQDLGTDGSYKYDFGVLTVGNQGCQGLSDMDCGSNYEAFKYPFNEPRALPAYNNALSHRNYKKAHESPMIAQTHEHQTSRFRKLHIATPQLLNLIK